MPLALRLAFTYVLITLTGVLLLGGGLLVLVERTLTQRRDAELAAQAALSAALLAELAPTTAELQGVANAVGGALPPGVVARVFSNEGLLLSATRELGPFPSRAALALVRSPIPLPASQVADRQYRAERIGNATATLGVVEISRDIRADTQLLQDLRRLVLQTAIGAALLMALLSVLISRAIARPVQRLTQRADALAQSVASGAIVPQPMVRSSRDEIVRLQQSLDHVERALAQRLERINTLEQARSHFYRSVSHELRTPLTAIQAGLENLTDTVPSAQQPAVAQLEAETARLTRLVDELLQPSADGNLAVVRWAQVDLAALIAEIGALLQGRAQRAGIVLTWCAEEPLFAQADRDRIKQALLNLLDNALRMTPPGGTVQLMAQRYAGLIELAVIDSGPGVPPDAQALIWQRGWSGPHAGRSGLGLALVRAIAEAHGGSADLDPTSAAGARFWIRLPDKERA
jgi:signal transduction histidine kinase